MALFDRGGTGEDLTDYDPLFYRGKSPVLGSAVELKTAGELPGEFPAAGAPPSPPTPGTPPTAPNRTFDFPGFNFDFSGFDFGAPPTPPTMPAETFGPGGIRPPWWAGVLEGVDRAASAAQKLRQMGQAPAESPAWLDRPGDFSLTGDPGAPWWATGTDPTSTGPFSLTGPDGQPILDPARFTLGGPAATLSTGLPNLLPSQSQVFETGPEAAATTGSVLRDVGGGLAIAGGLYGLTTGKTPEAKIGSGLSLLSGAGTIGGDLLGSTALSALGPWGGIMGAGWGLVNLAAGLQRQMQDPAMFPEPYVYIPETGGSRGAMAVDPNTGAILVYHGNGRYGWSDQTLKNERATPDQFQSWGIYPQGDLFQRPEYATVAHAIERGRAQQAVDTGARGGQVGSVATGLPTELQDPNDPATRALVAAQYGDQTYNSGDRPAPALPPWMQPIISDLFPIDPGLSRGGG
jgi:hypothetical protein